MFEPHLENGMEWSWKADGGRELDGRGDQEGSGELAASKTFSCKQEDFNYLQNLSEKPA